MATELAACSRYKSGWRPRRTSKRRRDRQRCLQKTGRKVVVPPSVTASVGRDRTDAVRDGTDGRGATVCDRQHCKGQDGRCKRQVGRLWCDRLRPICASSADTRPATGRPVRRAAPTSGRRSAPSSTVTTSTFRACRRTSSGCPNTPEVSGDPYMGPEHRRFAVRYYIVERNL